MSINRSILNQSNTIQISIDFVSEVYTFVEDNVRGETTHLNGETIRPKAVKQSDLKQLNILCKFPLFLY